MYSQLNAYLNKSFPSVEKEGLDKFASSFELKKFQKKTLLLEYGKIEKELRFINKGIVREYYMHDGNEVNLNFYSDSHFLTDFLSFHTKTASLRYHECLTDIEMLVLSNEKSEQLFNKYSFVQILIDTSFKRVLLANEKRDFEMVTKSPDTIYKELLKKHPDWLLKIPQYHIASYLRITPETLSRIRRRIS